MKRVGTQLEFFLNEIANKLQKLHEMSSNALIESMEAFKALDQEYANRVKRSTQAIDELADNIEDNIFETIARRQPVARDLRTVATYLQICHHLYRIGRYAYKVAHIVNLCEGEQHYKKLESLPFLADLAKKTLDIAMNAVLTRDLSHLDELEKLEAESDRETEAMFLEITDYLRKMDNIERISMFYVIVGRYFERAADHAFSIAERAIYMVTGKKKKLGLAYKSREWIGPH